MENVVLRRHCEIKGHKRTLLPIHEYIELNVEPNAKRASHESDKPRYEG